MLVDLLQSLLSFFFLYEDLVIDGLTQEALLQSLLSFFFLYDLFQWISTIEYFVAISVELFLPLRIGCSLLSAMSTCGCNLC